MKSTLEIQNLKCHGCANTIKNKLGGMEGVSNVLIDNANNTVSFLYEDEAMLASIKETLLKLGYPAIGDKNVITTKAKSFVSCAIGRINS